MPLPNPDRPPDLVCSMCNNRRHTGPATDVMSCGGCCYHSACRRSAGHCECGFPSTLVLKVGVQCIVCARPVATKRNLRMPLFCALHENVAFEQFALYARKGIDTAEDARGGCTPYKVLSGNGIMHIKINSRIGTVLARTVVAAALQVDSDICIYTDQIMTLATRMWSEMKKDLSQGEHHVRTVAEKLFPSMTEHATKMFQRQYASAGIFEHGTFRPKAKSAYATTIASTSVCVRCCLRFHRRPTGVRP